MASPSFESGPAGEVPWAGCQSSFTRSYTLAAMRAGVIALVLLSLWGAAAQAQTVTAQASATAAADGISAEGLLYSLVGSADLRLEWRAWTG